MRWNYRGLHGQLLVEMFRDGRAPYEHGFNTPEHIVKGVYDAYTEFNQNYTPKQFYPGYRRLARDYKDELMQAGGRRQQQATGDAGATMIRRDNIVRRVGDGRGKRIGRRGDTQDTRSTGRGIRGGTRGGSGGGAGGDIGGDTGGTNTGGTNTGVDTGGGRGGNRSNSLSTELITCKGKCYYFNN